jgi:hypothetical protein
MMGVPSLFGVLLFIIINLGGFDLVDSLFTVLLLRVWFVLKM